MAKRDPHDVLGVRRGASLKTIKAAWRSLARQHHPDLTGDDPGASRQATRRMAEINDAYEALRRANAEGGRSGGRDGRAPFDAGDAEEPRAGARRSGPPRPRPTRPVTGRVDTTNTFRPRNATMGDRPRGDRTASRGTASTAGGLRGQAPRPNPRPDREPPRASEPTGPLERGRIHRFRPPRPPTLDAARAVRLDFGKFRGHTLGEVAAFEPTYIDWLARTITRDRDLVAAARVIRDELDQQGVARRDGRQATSAGRSA